IDICNKNAEQIVKIRSIIIQGVHKLALNPVYSGVPRIDLTFVSDLFGECSILDPFPNQPTKHAMDCNKTMVKPPCLQTDK
ncbi:hypothetical protein AVEN_272917-1, partial [Araneus ventricosus]